MMNYNLIRNSKPNVKSFYDPEENIIYFRGDIILREIFKGYAYSIKNDILEGFLFFRFMFFARNVININEYYPHNYRPCDMTPENENFKTDDNFLMQSSISEIMQFTNVFFYWYENYYYKTGRYYLDMFSLSYDHDDDEYNPFVYEYPDMIPNKKYLQNDKILVICDEGHLTTRSIKDNKHIKKCKKCGHRQRRLYYKDLISRFNEIYGKDKFEYLNFVDRKENYKNTFKLEIKCKKDGTIIERNIATHLKNVNCPTCRGSNNHITGKELLEIFNQKTNIEGQLFVENDKKYFNRTKVDASCSLHGQYQVLVKNIKYNKFVCSDCSRMNVSTSIEDTVEEFLKTQNLGYIKNNRKILKGKEIDFIINKKFGIEVNGIYWHSNLVHKDYKKHIYDKFINSKKNDIHLLHLYEDDIKYKLDIVRKEILLMSDKLQIKDFDKYSLSIGKINKKEFINFFKLNSLEFINKDDNKFNGIFYKSFIIGLFSYNDKTNTINNYCINHNIEDNLDLKLIKETNPNFIFNIRNDSYNRFKFESEQCEIVKNIEPSYRNFNQKGKGKILNKRLERIDPEHPIRIYDAGRVLIELL